VIDNGPNQIIQNFFIPNPYKPTRLLADNDIHNIIWTEQINKQNIRINCIIGNHACIMLNKQIGTFTINHTP